MIERLNRWMERLREQYDALTPRDQRLALGLISGLSILFVGGLVWTLHGIVEDKASRIRAAKENLGTAQEMADSYAVARGKIEAAEQRMGQFRATQISSYLQTWATNASISDQQLSKVDEIDTGTLGSYKERLYRVEVQHAELTGVLKFLYAIETSPYPIRVKNATFSAFDIQGNRVIDLSLDLLTYSKEEG